jgi:hypothetical protein
VPVFGSMWCFSRLPAELLTLNSMHLSHSRVGIRVRTQNQTKAFFSTFRTTVVLSSTFRAKTCTTLEKKFETNLPAYQKKGIQKGCDCATNFYLYYYNKLIWRSAMEIVLDINVSNILQITLLFSKCQSLPIGQNHMTCW